jgi:protocatechuate 3,4-dioxygenase beta subunit
MTTSDPVSRLTRRRLLRDAGLAGATLLGGAALLPARGLAATTAAGALHLTPEETEGPFYVALERVRRDIRLGRAGIPLHLRLKVARPSGAPVTNAAVDVWHCDASGIYSDESQENTVGSTFLRGVQLTDASGLAEFVTIYPGQYAGRTTHIHVKVHAGGTTGGGRYRGGHVAHTGQLFFGDALTAHVYALSPYAGHTAARTTRAQDMVYTQQSGSRSVLSIRRLGATDAQGFLGTITLVVNPAATPAAF